MTNHIDQLARWWYEAEKGIPKKGDLVISCNDDDGTFDVHTISVDQRTQEHDLRILQRAPKPKPAWHNAVAVTASTLGFGVRRVFVPEAGGIWNDALSGRGTAELNLLDPVPLIEAKITDEMVERYRDEETKWRLEGGPSHPSVARHLIAAALGIEDE